MPRQSKYHNVTLIFSLYYNITIIPIKKEIMKNTTKNIKIRYKTFS